MFQVEIMYSHEFCHLHNYFILHVSSSIRPIGVYNPFASHPVTLPIPTVVSQNASYKSCLVCVKSVKYAVYVMLNLQRKNLKAHNKSAHEGKKTLNDRHICNTRFSYTRLISS